MVSIFRNGKIILQVPLNKGCKVNRTLMENDSITLPFSVKDSVKDSVTLKVGDYVDDTRFGNYCLINDYKPTYNAKTGAYDYTLVLYAYYYRWNNYYFKYCPENGGNELEWDLTSTLDVHLSILLKNLSSLGLTYKGVEFSFEIDNTISTEAKYIGYHNVHLVDALTMMAEAWECEWWIENNVIHFGRCYTDRDYEFEIGKSVETMTPAVSENTYGTRLYVFGSTKNLPKNYREADSSVTVNGIVQKRLMLPGVPYLDIKENLTKDEIVEIVKVFDNIFPKVDGKVDKVAYYEKDIKNEDGSINTNRYYCFRDNGIEFSEDYTIEGEALKLVFNSGKLNRMHFSVKFHADGQREIDNEEWHSGQVFEIIQNSDYGRDLPDDIIYPEEGDKYVLYNWDATKISHLGLVDKAEEELLQEGEKYIKEELLSDSNSYSCKVYADIAKQMYQGNVQSLYNIGDGVRLVDSVLFDKGYRNSRIIGYEINLDIPYDNPVFIVGEKPNYSRLKNIEEKVDSIVYKGETFAANGVGSSIYVIKRNDETPLSDKNVLSSLRSKQEFLNKNEADIANEEITFKKGIIARLVSSIEQIITNRISSSVFSDGFVGQGWQIWKDEQGVSHLTIDTLTVRQLMSIYELIIQKERSVNGGLIVSPANGKIKSVKEEGENYAIEFEDSNPYIAGDFIRCQEFTGSQKFYWVEIDSVSHEFVHVAKSKFTSSFPEIGDETSLCGSKNPNRQGVIRMSSAENGTPKIEILGNVSSTSFEGCLRVCSGYIGDITDEDFGNNQPKGYGLYSDNAYLKGEFFLANRGESVDTLFNIQDGKLQSSIAQTQAEAIKGKTLLYNASFTKQLDGWQTSNDEGIYYSDDSVLFSDDSAWKNSVSIYSEPIFDNAFCVNIKNGWIKQYDWQFVDKPSFEEGKEYPIYFSANVRCHTSGTLIVKVGNVKLYEAEIKPSADFVVIDAETKWNGTGDFELSFSGDADFYGLTIYTEKTEVRHVTLFEQTDRIIKATASLYYENGELLTSGFVIKPERAGLFTQDRNGNVATIGTYKNGIIKLSGSEIQLEGEVSANGNVVIKSDGTIKAVNGEFSGTITGDGLVLENTNANNVLRILPTTPEIIMELPEHVEDGTLEPSENRIVAFRLYSGIDADNLASYPIMQFAAGNTVVKIDNREIRFTTYDGNGYRPENVEGTSYWTGSDLNLGENGSIWIDGREFTPTLIPIPILGPNGVAASYEYKYVLIGNNV